MNHPKATLLTLEQLNDEFTDDQLTDVVKAADRLRSMGCAQRIDTVWLAQRFIDNEEMNKFIASTLHAVTMLPYEDCTEEAGGFIELAMAFTELAAAVYWRCKGPERLAETISQMGSISRQIDQPDQPQA